MEVSRPRSCYQQRRMRRTRRRALSEAPTTKTALLAVVCALSSRFHAVTAAADCAPGQHTFEFTLVSDSQSRIDNSWKLKHATSGTFIEGGNHHADGTIVYGVCADEEPSEYGADACYDFELHDHFGDGLTLPRDDGMAGGWTVRLNGEALASHTAERCPLDREEGNAYNECASEHGFEYCGVRICASGSVKNLPGSRCALDWRVCGDSPGQATDRRLAVAVSTDSFGEEFSWDLRRAGEDLVSSKEMIMNGGSSDGLGVPYESNEDYMSTTCQDGDIDNSLSCYDFRAYDGYGDGLGCGANGSIRIEQNGQILLLQEDEDMAAVQTVKRGRKKRLACLGEGLESWSICAVRFCANGDIIPMEGNQCSFGLENMVIDSGNYGGGVDVPIQTSSVSKQGKSGSSTVQFNLSGQSYSVKLSPWATTLLAIDAPFELVYNRPKQLSKFVSLFLMDWMLTVDDWEQENAVTDFDLDCTKDRVGTDGESYYILFCSGNAVFSTLPLPLMVTMDELVIEAFQGDYREDLLKYLYPGYGSNDGNVFQTGSNEKVQKVRPNGEKGKNGQPNRSRKRNRKKRIRQKKGNQSSEQGFD